MLRRSLRNRLRWGELGATAIEQALLVAAIAAVVVGVSFGFGAQLESIFSDTCHSVATSSASATGTTTDPASCSPSP